MYNIAVKIEGIENKKRSVFLLHIIAGFYLLLKAAEFSSKTEETPSVLIFLFVVTGFISLGYGFFRKRIDPFVKYNIWIRALQVISLAMFGLSRVQIGGASFENYIFIIWAALFLFMLFLERRIFSDTDLQIKESGVLVPGVYKDVLLSWKELEDVVIRHDFVTIFNRNKKFLQFQVLQDLSELEVAKMNAFCKEKLEEIKEKQLID